jgi:hypothetical protein
MTERKARAERKARQKESKGRVELGFRVWFIERGEL